MRSFILVLGLLSPWIGVGVGVGVGLDAQPATPARDQAAARPAADRAAAGQPNQPSQPGQPGRGKFLVARRSLNDPNFARTVVFLVEHGEQGTVGVIINRPTTAKLSDQLSDQLSDPLSDQLGPGGAERPSDPIYWGGPVAHGTMLLLLRASEAPDGAQPVFRDVYRSGSRELLERLLSQPDSVDDLRVYSGHAGWAPGQLEAEIERGGWHVMPGDPNLIFSSAPSAVWPELIGRATLLRARHERTPSGDRLALAGM